MTPLQTEARLFIMARGKDDFLALAHNINYASDYVEVSLPLKTAAYAIGWLERTGRMDVEKAKAFRQIKGAKAADKIAALAEKLGGSCLRDYAEEIRAM